MTMVELTILMPCLNEAETLATCIGKARGFLDSRGIVGEVLIADNGSTDGSQQIAESLGARVVPVPIRGYGAALNAGIHAAAGEFVIMGDADDSYDFSSLDDFVRELRAGRDLVMGNRFAGGILPGAMPKLHKYLGNPVLSAVGRLFFRSPIGDFHCGLRGFRRDAAVGLDLRTTGMEFASEMVVKATLYELDMAEVPIVLHPDGRSRPPHLRSWRDGWRHLRFLLIYSPRWLFLYPGVALTVVSAILAVALVFGPIQLGPIRLGVGAHFLTAIATMVGYQAVIFAVLSKVYGQLAGFRPDDKRFSRWLGRIKLENGLGVGVALAAVGIVAAIVSFVRWRDANWGNVQTGDSIRTVVPAALGIVLGMQTILASFFLSILGIPHTAAGSGSGSGETPTARPSLPPTRSTG
ncbi:MAG: hypothetical protein QOF60_1187 [Actinomycetota bacterium]|jgi:hypothetical protein|nr:hypothetical protein [Actinomycetota bacterium]